MAATDFIVAIELGSSKITGIAGKKHADGSIQVLALASENSSDFIRKGVIYNLDKTAQSLTSIIKKLESTLKASIGKVYVGIGGQSLRTIRNTEVRHLEEETKISQELIDSIMDSNREVPIIDQEILEVAPQEYKVGINLLADPVGVPSDHIEGRFLNIIARNSVKQNIDKCFKQAGIEIADYIISPLALANAVLTNSEKRSGCMFIDFGADTTTVSVYKNNILRHLAVIPLGGSNITKDICSQQIEEEDAEELKKILQVLDETLNDDQMLYVNLHSLVKDVIPIQGYQHICSFPEGVDNYEFLMGCDMLITDYSSVLFDFALTKRPVILFVYDAEEYARDRGMYFSVQDLPFVKAETLKQLQEYITKQKSVEISKAAWNAYADVFVSKAAFDPAVCLKKVPVDSITDYADNKNKERTVYFIPKIKRLQDIQYLKEAAEDHSAIAVLDRQDFTPLTQKLLYQEFHECLDYIVMDVRMQLSPKEELKRLLHRFPGMEAYRREFQRILPNIKVKECVDFKKSRYTFGMKKYIDSQNRR